MVTKERERESERRERQYVGEGGEKPLQLNYITREYAESTKLMRFFVCCIRESSRVLGCKSTFEFFFFDHFFLLDLFFLFNSFVLALAAICYPVPRRVSYFNTFVCVCGYIAMLCCHAAKTLVSVRKRQARARDSQREQARKGSK